MGVSSRGLSASGVVGGVVAVVVVVKLASFRQKSLVKVKRPSSRASGREGRGNGRQRGERAEKNGGDSAIKRQRAVNGALHGCPASARAERLE